MILNLESPLSKLKKVVTLDRGKLYSHTMPNDEAHLIVVKTEAARFCKNDRAPRAYSIVPLSSITLGKIFFIRVLKSAALKSGPLINVIPSTYSTISCMSW